MTMTYELRKKIRELTRSGGLIIPATEEESRLNEEEEAWFGEMMKAATPVDGFKRDETEVTLRMAFTKLRAYKLEPEAAARVVLAVYVASKQENE